MNFTRKAFYLCATCLMVCFAITPIAHANLLLNPSFETPGPNGPSMSYTGKWKSQKSSAQDWLVWNNTLGTTTTELVTSTLPGESGKMIHVTTDGDRNGLYQAFLDYGTGPSHVMTSVWIYVISGVVGIGAGNGGHIIVNAFTDPTWIGEWRLLEGVNNTSPANEAIIYSFKGGANFYLDEANASHAPLPPALLLLGSGLLGLLGWRRFRTS